MTAPRPTAAQLAAQLAALRIFDGRAKGSVSGDALRSLIANGLVQLGGLCADGYTIRMVPTTKGRAALDAAKGDDHA